MQVREDSEKQWREVDTVSSTTTSYTVEELTAGKAYWFRIAGKNKSGVGEFLESTETVKLEKKATEPSPPLGPLELTAVSGTSFSVTWKAPASDGGAEVTGYAVLIRELTRTTWLEAAAVDGKTLSATVSDLSAGTEYQVMSAFIHGG